MAARPASASLATRDARGDRAAEVHPSRDTASNTVPVPSDTTISGGLCSRSAPSGDSDAVRPQLARLVLDLHPRLYADADTQRLRR